MNRSLITPLAFASLISAVSLWPSTAIGQDRIEQPSIPDLSTYEAALPLGTRWDRYRRGKGTSAAWSLGVGFGTADGASGGVGAGTAALGWRSPTTVLGVSSQLTGLIPAEGEGLELAKTRGKHRALGVVHFGKRRDDHGVHLGIDSWARHSGEQGFRLDQVRFGSAPMWTLGTNLETTLRAGDAEVGVAVPVKGHAEDTHYRAGALERVRTKGLGLGLGLHVGDRDTVRGNVRFIGANVEHSRFDQRANFSATDGVAGGGIIANEYRKVKLGAGLDNLTFFDRDALGTFSLDLGWSWLESDVAGETLSLNAADVRFGSNFKFGDPDETSRIGFAVSRNPDRTADGSRLTSEWRLELDSTYDHGRVDMRASGSLSWLSAKEGGDGTPTPTILRYGAQLEGFIDLPLNFQAGAYVGSSFEPHRTLDPWSVGRSWDTETGLLLRWKRPANSASKSHRGFCGTPNVRPIEKPIERPIQRPIRIRTTH